MRFAAIEGVAFVLEIDGEVELVAASGIVACVGEGDLGGLDGRIWNWDFGGFGTGK